MTIGDLREEVAPFFQLSAAGLTVSGTDLFMKAVNAARKRAEMKHDFEYSRNAVDIEVDGVTGGELSTAKLAGTETPLPGSIKLIERVGVVQNGRYIGLRFRHVKGMMDDIKKIDMFQEYDSELRYPSDAHFTASRNLHTIYQLGTALYRYPEGTSGETLSLRCHVVSLLPAYEDDADTDFFLDHGSDYLKWATICELNYHFKTFVPREEGNLNPPTRERDQALQDLILWDSYLIEPNADHYQE